MYIFVVVFVLILCSQPTIASGIFGSVNNPADSCEAIATCSSTSAGYYLKDQDGIVSNVYCHMEPINGCGPGPWTLAIKADGSKTTFHPDSSLWQNNSTFSPESSKSGLDTQETKTIAYHAIKFTKLCLGMRALNSLQWIALDYPNDKTLFDVLADNTYRATNLGRDQWKKLISGSSLQSNCNMEGFNVNIPDLVYASARIGIISNEQNDCHSPDSRIGFGIGGTSGGQHGGNTVGNEARAIADNGDKTVQAFGYVFVQKATVNTESESICQDDKCGYRIISDVYRSTGHTASPGDPLKCDKNLVEGWYRFNSSAGSEMPTGPVEMYHCGTYGPVWMMGPHPKVEDGTVEVDVCGDPKDRCTGDLADQFKWKIQVKNCSGGFYIYKLKPTPSCDLAYCAGDEKPCPIGTASTTGRIGENCSEAYPVLHLQPTIRPTMTYRPGVNGYISLVTLSCEFEFSNLDSLVFQMHWFVDGSLVLIQNLTTERQGKLVENLYPGDKSWKGFNAGDRVQCKVRGRFTHFPFVLWSQFKDSSVFYAGIEVTPSYLTVKESDLEAGTIQLKSNIPFKCPKDENNSGGSSVDCSLIVYLDQGDTDVAWSQCTLKLNKANNFTDTIKVKGVRDFVWQYYQQFIIRFVIKTEYLSIADELDKEAFFWNLYTMTVRITKVSSASAGAQCSSTGDPHIHTFDRFLHHLTGHPGPGDYVLVKNPERNFEIQTRVWPCWAVMCNCGVAIRDYNDVIKIDMCNGRWGETSEDIVQLSHNCLSKNFKIKRNGRKYQIWLPSGREVDIYVEYYGMNVYVRLTSDDYSKTQGMCGNFNGKYYDDLEGMSHVEFLKKHKRSSSLFDQIPEPVQEEPSLCVCGASNDVSSPWGHVNCDVKHNNELSGFPVKVLKSGAYCPINKRKRRSVDITGSAEDDLDDGFSDNVGYIYVPDPNFVPITPTWPTPSGTTETEANNYCLSIIKNTKAGNICETQVGVNLTKTLGDCVFDIKVSDNKQVAQASVEVMIQQCTFQAMENASTYEQKDNTTLVPPLAILGELCPGDCSLQGNCSNGTCLCNQGFTGTDCSFDMNQIPVLIRMAKDGLCDIRKYRCGLTRAVAEGLVDQNLTCLLQEMKREEEQWVVNNTVIELPGVLEGSRKVRCPLPAHPVKLGDPKDGQGVPVSGFMVSVLKDNITSNQLAVLVYDSVCIECEAQGNCSLKNDTCEIRGYCLAANDSSPSDWCMQCLPEQSNSSWSKRQGNLPPVFHSNTTHYVKQNEIFELELEADDPENRTISYSLVTKHDGLSVTTDGRLTWDKVTGDLVFVVRVMDACSASLTQKMSIIAIPLIIDGGNTMLAVWVTIGVVLLVVLVVILFLYVRLKNAKNKYQVKSGMEMKPVHEPPLDDNTMFIEK